MQKCRNCLPNLVGIFFVLIFGYQHSVGDEPSKCVLIGALLFFIFIFSFGIIKL